MLIVWLVFTFGLLTQPTQQSDTTHAAIIAASPATSIYSSDTNEDLENAESKDAKKLEIIKQIRRVNSDGSFVVGYEAVDGTFKIESRDVLGNVKGTYGYVDENGEIKRVSYTANNTTNGLKSVPNQIVHMPRINKTVLSTSTTHRSSSVGSSTPTTVRLHSNIITIPKKRIFHSSSTQATKNQNITITPIIGKIDQHEKSEPTTTVVYATSMQSTTTPSIMSSSLDSISRTNKIEINDRFSRVFNVNKISKDLNDTSGLPDLKSERRLVRGNILRRQLSNDQSENFETNPQIVYSQTSDEDSVHGTQRPIFTTTSSPRIPSLVLAARNRAAMLKNAALQNADPTEKIYSKPSRKKSDRTEDNSSFSEPSSDNDYLTQSPTPSQIPTKKESVHNDNGHTYRQLNTYLPKSKEHIRGTKNEFNRITNAMSNPRHYKFPMQTNFLQPEVESEQYLRETSETDVKDPNSLSLEHYANNDVNAETHPILQSFMPKYQRLYGSQPNLRTESDQRFQQFPLHPYQTLFNGATPPYQSYLDRPLTARDFERLLNFLVLRHQQYQRLPFSPGQNFPSGFNNYYGGYNPYYQHIPRPTLYNQFDPRYTAFSRYLPPVPPPNSLYAPYSEQENMYQAQNPIEQQLPYVGTSMQSRQNYNNKQYFNSNHFSQQKVGTQDNTEYLPPDVREELLYRMLMLSIQSDITANMATIPVPAASNIKIASTTTSSPESNSKKPIRSVQILGEE